MQIHECEKLVDAQLQFKQQMSRQLKNLFKSTKSTKSSKSSFGQEIRMVQNPGLLEQDAMFMKPCDRFFKHCFTLGMYRDNQLITTVQLIKNWTHHSYDLHTMALQGVDSQQNILLSVALILLHRIDMHAKLDMMFLETDDMAAFCWSTPAKVTVINNKVLTIATAPNQQAAFRALQTYKTMKCFQS